MEHDLNVKLAKAIIVICLSISTIALVSIYVLSIFRTSSHMQVAVLSAGILIFGTIGSAMCKFIKKLNIKG